MPEQIILQAVVLLIGFGVLTWSADRFVDGAAVTARRLGVSPLLVGLTIVGLGTSAPEMLVSGLAAWEGSPGLAVGNALGSNIANVGLILGAAALTVPLAVRSQILRRELPVLLLVMAFSVVLLWGGQLSRLEGWLLLAGLAGLLGWFVVQGRREGKGDVLEAEYADEFPTDMPLGRALIQLTVGLVGLLLSSRALVWAATELARAFGVSDLVIGLTIVALGTSLPELAAAIASARKGEHDIAIGNVLGSNMFNLLGVMGIAAAIRPVAVAPEALSRDFLLMVVLTLGFFGLSHGLGRSGRVGRGGGLLLVGSYVGYQIYLYIAG